MALTLPAALLASFGVCWLLLASRRAHGRLTVDGTIPGLEKVHPTPVPRIGGFGVLAGVEGVAILAAFAGVAAQVGNTQLLQAALVVGAAVRGFLAWNDTRRAIFARDGGAYFLGFAIGELAVLLILRSSEASQWFALLVPWYPVWETVYSTYRRKVMQGASAASADGLHLRSLIYHRVVGNGHGRKTPAARSALTTMFMLAMSLLTDVPA